MPKVISNFERQLCDIQGRLFELALKNSHDCPSFISDFMGSETAEMLDRSYDRLQWAGEEYILLNLEEEKRGLQKAGTKYDKEIMFWTGYIYRYWHYLTGESSKEIYSQADEKTMKGVYWGFHTLDNRVAIEDLKELYRQKCEFPENKG